MVAAPIPRLFALIGNPVAGNPTQEVVEDAFRRLGLDWRYVSARVLPEDLPAAIGGLRALGFSGAHVTVPHKVAAVPLLDELSVAAGRIKAVNCIVAEDGRLLGHNTDGRGLVAAVSPLTRIQDARVVMFGAGGAARAIAVELALAGAGAIRLVNRDVDRRSGVAALLQELGVSVVAEPWPDKPLAVEDATILVNATTIGMGGDEAGQRVPVDWSTAHPDLVAADVVIERSTAFVDDARASGVATVGGIDMLVEQAVLSIELWTGLTPDRAALRRRLETEIHEPGGRGR